MSTQVQTIKTVLQTKLQGVTNLQDVYKYEIATPTEGRYPFATVIAKDGEGEFGDTIRNIRKYRFQVNIYQERTDAARGNQDAEVILDGIIDEVLTAFDNDTTLSGTVKYVKPLSWNTDYVDREIGDTRVCQFVIEATQVVDSTTI
jgi:hypothetical protein